MEIDMTPNGVSELIDTERQPQQGQCNLFKIGGQAKTLFDFFVQKKVGRGGLEVHAQSRILVDPIELQF